MVQVQAQDGPAVCPLCRLACQPDCSTVTISDFILNSTARILVAFPWSAPT